jgi:type VI secretion system protein VasG
LIASLEAQVESIRTVHLLQALQNSPHCLKARDAWPVLSLSSTALQRLLPKLDELSEESPQNQILQTNYTAHAEPQTENSKEKNKI